MKLHEQIGQHGNHGQSTALHSVFSVIMVAFGLARFAALFEERLVLAACFLGFWSSISFLLSADGCVAVQLESGLDVAAMTYFGGMLSSCLCAALIFCAQSGCPARDPYMDLESVEESAQMVPEVVGKPACEKP